MDMILVVFWAFFLCMIVSILIMTFPAAYPRESIKKGAIRIQIISILIDVVGCIVAIILSRAVGLSIIFVDMKLAVMLIPVIACLFFSVFLYYPSVRFLVEKNIEDQSKMDELLTCIFKSSYANDEGHAKHLNDLAELQSKEEEFIKQYGLSVYLTEYVSQAQYPITNRPPEATIRCVLDRCNQVKHDVDTYSPIPFPHIGLILSFVFSTFLTVLLSIVAII
jgi:hypothetical protein